MITKNSESCFERAVKVMPGGVNSPVRAFRSVGMTPRFIAKGEDDRLIDEDGNTYIDFVNSWGPLVFGHCNPAVKAAVENALQNGFSFGAATKIEVEVAELICSVVPNVDMVRMVNSGTEAVMSALRLARGYTGRDKIIKFAGCYHGHSDSMLVSAGSGLLTEGIASSAGVTKGVAADTLVARYNDLASVEALFDENPGQVACVIVEPVAANMGCVPPKDGFLQGLRDLCDKNGALLIFDEVITGFRLALGGAQEYFGVNADIVTFGKIIGGGFPVGAYGARRELMELVAPVGPVYQAGTLSGNPIAMAAGYETLKNLKAHPVAYDHLAYLGNYLKDGITDVIRKYHLPCVYNSVRSLSSIFFTDREVIDEESAKTSDTAAFAKYFATALNRGVYVAPSQFEVLFLSERHITMDMDKLIDAFEEYAKSVQK